MAPVKRVEKHQDLEVYDRAFDAAMRIFELTKKFPDEERYTLTDQIRRSSRSVCANLAEAWRKRAYVAAFKNKLSDATGEAGETQVWLQFSAGCSYMTCDEANALQEEYDGILRTLVGMITHPESWTLPSKAPARK